MKEAGLLLYTYNPKDRKFYYLVQFILEKDWIEDFRGTKELGYTLRDTAIDSFIQETNNVLGLTRFNLLELIIKNRIHYKTKNKRYHLFVIPVSPNYLKYKPADFGPKELYENVSRICKWMTLDEIIEYNIHPRLEEFIKILL